MTDYCLQTIASPNLSKKPGKIKFWTLFLVDKQAEFCGTT